MNAMNISPIKITEKYEDRLIEECGILEVNGWKLKLYKITYRKNSPADEKTLDIAVNFFKDAAFDYTAKYDDMTPSYGLGYVILHKGMDSNFIAVNWWSGENMLVTRAMLAPLNDPCNYNEITQTGMNICVWDMLVHNHERNAWVESILKNPSSPKTEEYINSFYKK
jgi:hypothetical protein